MSQVTRAAQTSAICLLTAAASSLLVYVYHRRYHRRPKERTAAADFTPREADVFIAAKFGAQQTVQLLIEAGADVYKANTDGETPLLVAAQAGITNQCSCSSTRVLTWIKQTRKEPHHCLLLHTTDINNQCSCSLMRVLTWTVQTRTELHH